MSYCRRSAECDLYIYHGPGDLFWCESCFLTKAPLKDRFFKTIGGLKLHILAHKRAGHKVPDSVLDYIQDEILAFSSKATANDLLSAAHAWFDHGLKWRDHYHGPEGKDFHLLPKGINWK